IFVQAWRRRGLGWRAFRLGRRDRLALARLLARLLALLLVLLLVLLLRLGRRRGLRWSYLGSLRLLTLGCFPGVGLPRLLRFLLFRVRHGLFRFHARNRLARFDRDSLHGAILVHPAPDSCGIPRLGVEQHDLRRRDRRRQLDDAAL